MWPFFFFLKCLSSEVVAFCCCCFFFLVLKRVSPPAWSYMGFQNLLLVVRTSQMLRGECAMETVFYINKHNKVRLPRDFYHSPFDTCIHSVIAISSAEDGCQNHALFLECWLGPCARRKFISQKWIKRGLEKQMFSEFTKSANTRI